MLKTNIDDTARIPCYADMIFNMKIMIQLFHQCLILLILLIQKFLVCSHNH